MLNYLENVITLDGETIEMFGSCPQPMCFPEDFPGLQLISALKGNGFAAAAGERAEGEVFFL